MQPFPACLEHYDGNVYVCLKMVTHANHQGEV